MTAQPGRQPTGPSRVWYWVAGAAVAASVVWLAAGIFLGIRGFCRQVEGFQRLPIPGEAEVRFDAPGGYTVYFEGLGAADEQVALPSRSVSLVPADGGEEVPVDPYSGSSTYTVGGRSGRAIGTFRIDAPGRFLIRTEGDLEGGQGEIAVGSSIGPIPAGDTSFATGTASGGPSGSPTVAPRRSTRCSGSGPVRLELFVTAALALRRPRC